jgi:amidase
MRIAIAVVAVLLVSRPSPALVAQSARTIPFDQASIRDINDAFDAGTQTSERLVQMCLARIREFDRQGPMLRGIITVNPRAVEQARQLDVERRAKGKRSPLHGVPIVLKDNVDTADMPTTAGSVLLEGSVPPRDAFLTTRLREAGAVIVAKTNMSEFASGPAVSSLGGQMKNPHDLVRTTLGSSGGVGISISAAYAMVGIGTDTGGSIRNPSSATGVVGLKPTIGLISRRGIVPLALSFDTAGPIARSVADVATTLGIIAGADPEDAATARSDGHVVKDYTTFLDARALSSARIGIARDFLGQDPDVDWAIDAALDVMRKQGATVVDVSIPGWLLAAKGDWYEAIRYPEFAAQIADYLATLGPSYPKNIDQLIARSQAFTSIRADGAGPNPGRWTLFKREGAAVKLDDPRYLAVRDHALALVRAIIEGTMTAQRLDAIVYPTLPRRPPLITAPTDPPGGVAGAPVNIANLTGFPDLIVPAGFTGDGLPVTISFLGPAFSEPRLLALGYGFEEATHARRLPIHTPLLNGQVIELPAR